MSDSKLPSWNSDAAPIYAIEKSYLENAEMGPFFQGSIPPRRFPPKEMWSDFLGFPVASPIGIPAGPLLNARWIAFAAQMGFDILTYKTIRSQSYAAHPPPNMIYVETQGFLADHATLKQAKSPPTGLEHLAVTNSFGMPSRTPEYLVEDIAKANSALKKGQIMIVSIVGTPRPQEDFYEDFVKAGVLARDAGAKVIEVNFSCPNVKTCEGSLFTDAEAVYEICYRLKKVLKGIPLIVKLGVFSDKEVLRKVMQASARAGAQAVCGINTISAKIVNDQGFAALGEGRLNAGICGGPIRQAALDFVQKAHEINRKDKLGLTIMATGGATEPHHFDLFLEYGADIAMSATGMVWDPYLALRYHQQKEKHG